MASAVDAIRTAAVPFERDEDAVGPLVDRIGDARLVLIGEASHGTHEFYRFRAALTRALISRKRVNIIAAEADWPDAYRANRWVRHLSIEPDASSALDDFTRFPRWMWRNRELADAEHTYNLDLHRCSGGHLLLACSCPERGGRERAVKRSRDSGNWRR